MHLCFSEFIFLPAVSDSNLQQRDPKSSAAVLELCVPHSRNAASTAVQELGHRLTQKRPFELSHPTHQLNRSKARIYFQRLFSPAIVTGFWKVDGYIRPVNKWDSGNASKIASPTTNRSFSLYLKGKMLGFFCPSSSCCYYIQLWK